MTCSVILYEVANLIIQGVWYKFRTTLKISMNSIGMQSLFVVEKSLLLNVRSGSTGCNIHQKILPQCHVRLFWDCAITRSQWAQIFSMACFMEFKNYFMDNLMSIYFFDLSNRKIHYILHTLVLFLKHKILQNWYADAELIYFYWWILQDSCFLWADGSIILNS